MGTSRARRWTTCRMAPGEADARRLRDPVRPCGRALTLCRPCLTAAPRTSLRARPSRPSRRRGPRVGGGWAGPGEMRGEMRAVRLCSCSYPVPPGVDEQSDSSEESEEEKPPEEDKEEEEEKKAPTPQEKKRRKGAAGVAHVGGSGQGLVLCCLLPSPLQASLICSGGTGGCRVPGLLWP